MKRRAFLRTAAAGLTGAAVSARAMGQAADGAKPLNVVYVFADQWRAQATGYGGDPNVQTPHIDAMAGETVNLTHAVAGMPVCCPYRATLMTGRYPHTHGVFLNDLCLSNDAVSMAQAYAGAGYDTAYIGKWHLDGHGRSSYIPRERRQGFDFWKVLECTHNYNQSYYYGDTPEKMMWQGYDAIAQTAEAARYIREHPRDKPFLLVLSWGPPHNPYETAPERFKAMYDPATLTLPPNVPAESEAEARRDLAGYYAHCTALDECVGTLRETLRETGLEDDTLFIFTSDHGDMLGSQGERRKQRPWDESIRVPFLVQCPRLFGRGGRTTDFPINTPDILPTLLTLCGVPVPDTVEGRDRSAYLHGAATPDDAAAVIACYSPFGEWTRKQGGREYRGLRTVRYTYVRTLEGPWLLYDNEADPYQLENLVNRPEHADLQARLDAQLGRMLDETNDAFLPGEDYIAQWGYEVDESGTIPIMA